MLHGHLVVKPKSFNQVRNETDSSILTGRVCSVTMTTDRSLLATVRLNIQ